MFKFLITSILILSFASFTYARSEGAKPLYEVGLGAGAFYAPDYPGAEQSRDRYIGVPFFIYRGKIVKSDEDGLRGEFLEHKNYRFDLSFSAAFPAVSEDNRARDGMPDLDWIGEVGPRVLFFLKQDYSGMGKISLSLPLRAVFSSDFTRLDGRGFVFHPTISFKKRYLSEDKLSLIARFGSILASEETMDYFYEVPAAYATASRPSYNAQSGYLESHLDFAMVYKVNSRWTVFGGFLTSFYNGATNEASPLLKVSSTTSVAVGFSWTFYKSEVLEDQWY